MISKTVYLGLGSNMGDRFSALHKALRELSKVIKIKHISSFYQTAAVGPEQNDFYNLAACGTTLLEPMELLENIKAVEKKMGRTVTYPWGPRVIDIDILLYEKVNLNFPGLRIPHGEIIKRRFVLEPLLEIAGNMPINDRTLFYYLNQNLGQRCEKIKLAPCFSFFNQF